MSTSQFNGTVMVPEVVIPEIMVPEVVVRDETSFSSYSVSHRPNLTERMASVHEQTPDRYDCITIEAPPSYSVVQ